MSRKRVIPVREYSRYSKRPHRGESPGRRRTDAAYQAVATRKVVVGAVVVVNTIYLAGELLLIGQSLCPGS